MTATDIANLALSHIGAARINNLDTDNTPEAKSLRTHFAATRNELLRRYQWDFGTTRRTLAQDATFTPDAEWTQAWQMPVDCERIISIIDQDPHNPLLHFAREGRLILTNGLDTCRLKYISNDVPVQHWDSLFIKAFSLKLASEIAQDITQNQSIADAALQKFNRLALPAATNADARETQSGENRTIRSVASQSALVRARYRADGLPPY